MALSFIVIVINFYSLCPTLVASSLKTLKEEVSFLSVEETEVLFKAKLSESTQGNSASFLTQILSSQPGKLPLSKNGLILFTAEEQNLLLRGCM